jgi:hypothetical protein
MLYQYYANFRAINLIFSTKLYVWKILVKFQFLHVLLYKQLDFRCCMICEKAVLFVNYFTHVIMRFGITVQAKRARYTILQRLQIDNYKTIGLI